MPDYQTFGVITILALWPLGFVLLIWARLQRAGNLRGRLIFLGCIFMGIGGLCFAATWQYAIHTSEKVTLQGTICALSQVHGKGSASFFNLQNNVYGVSSRLSTDYAGERLENGEQVRLTRLSNSMDVTDLEVLSGPYSGWKLHEGNGTISSAFMLLLSGGFIFLAFYTRRTNPNGLSRAGNVSGNPVNSGVDEQSLLDLDDR